MKQSEKKLPTFDEAGNKHENHDTFGNGSEIKDGKKDAANAPRKRE